MSYQTIEIDRDARGVATLWLARADKHNAMSAGMIAELTRAAADLGADPQVRVVVLAARGKSFCAGGDLDWMRAQLDADATTRRCEARRLAQMLQALNTLPRPLIGRVQGNAFGGGIGLISVCDTVVGADHVEMALTETRLGLIPATIGPYVAARIGEARARRVFLSGRRFGTEDAVRMDLLARAVPAQALDGAVEQEVTPYLSCAPEAVARAKALLRALGPRIDDAVIEHSVDELVRCWEGDEARDGIAAFFARRKPRWNTG